MSFNITDIDPLLTSKTNNKNKHHSSNKRKHIFIGVVIALLICVGLISVSFITNTWPFNSEAKQNAQYDIIVVGGGPSGLIQARLIQQQYPKYKILVIEKQNRLGGRSFSTTLSYHTPENNLTFEHGAMRFYTGNTLIRKMLSYLKLCDRIEPFDNTNYGRRRMMENVEYFSSRNYYVKRDEVTADFWLNAYDLLSHERDLVYKEPNNPLKAMLDVILDELIIENKKLYPLITDQGWEQFENEWKLNGIVLNEWSLPMLFRYFNYSNEFQQLIKDEIEENLLPPYGDSAFFYDFDKLYTQQLHSNNHQRRLQSSTVFTLTTGYDTISMTLASLFEENGGQILIGKEVIAIDGSMETDNIYTVITNEEGKEKKYKTKSVILAIPETPLKNILPNIPALDDNDTWALVDSIYPQGRICKINLVFDEVYNISLNEISHSVDLSANLGSIYVWFGEQTNGLVVTHFYITSSSACDTWWNLQEISLNNGSSLYGIEYLDDIVIDENDDYNDLDVLTTYVVIQLYDELKNFVTQALGIEADDLPLPILGTMQAWGQLSRGATLIRWRRGVNRNDIMSQIDKPKEIENIFIGISDWSVNTGFVEGAIDASIKNLERNFDITDFLADEPECALP
eukprot:486431_1